jgi:hypothetical protein
MTPLEIYLLVAPFVLLAVGWGATYYWVRRSDREDQRAKQSGPIESCRDRAVASTTRPRR